MIPIVAATAGLAGVAIYACIWPTAQLFGKTIVKAEPKSRMLALTYDDGPNGAMTERLVALLQQYRVRATFFMIGRHAERQPDLVHDIALAGHAIGNHGYSHAPLISLSQARIRDELVRCQDTLARVAGTRPRFFRPPFGVRSPSVLRAASSLGLTPVLWSVTCFDWQTTTTEAVARHATRQIVGGDVILLHDGGHQEIGADRSATIEASHRLIEHYGAKGFQFVTVDKICTLA